MSSARYKLENAEPPKVVTLNHGVGGMSKGDLMFVANPRIIADYIRAIPYGEIRSVDELRAELAACNGCAGTCPASTLIFLRIAAEAALEDMEIGRPASEVIPFWRILTSKDKIAHKLKVDGEWIDGQRMREGAGTLH